jgi:adenylate cyclase
MLGPASETLQDNPSGFRTFAGICSGHKVAPKRPADRKQSAPRAAALPASTLAALALRERGQRIRVAFRGAARLLVLQLINWDGRRRALPRRFLKARPIVSEDATGGVRRRLAAILFAGYKRLQPGDEASTFTGLTLLRTEIIEPQVLKFGGRIIRWTGDNVFVELPSVFGAVRCAAALIEAASRLNETVLPDRSIALSVGINLDDIIVKDGDLFGDGVNIAARLQALAEPGSIYISAAVYDRIVDKVDFDFIDLGPQILKNISRPIRVYQMDPRIGSRPAGAIATGSEPEAAARFDDRRAIAVLPFLNLSDDPEQQYFADGITEDVISMLAGWRAFPVIAPDSTLTFKGKAVDIKKVGEQLGARYIVEGSVRKSGHRVRITAQLIRADTGHHIMSERLDRDLLTCSNCRTKSPASSRVRLSRNF